MSGYESYKNDKIYNNPKFLIFIAILSFLMGILFILMQRQNKPVARNQALFYSAAFDSIESSENYYSINCTDGSVYELYPHILSNEVETQLEKLKKGTRLFIGVNPNNNYVVELKAGSKELLNFEATQQAIDKYDNGYIAIGVMSIFASGFLLFFGLNIKKYKLKEKALQNHRKKNLSTYLREAEETKKQKILLTAEIGGYNICYRRIKFTNELVINGKVYEERKGILEFEHKLQAVIGGDKIEAGLNKNSESYIKFNGKKIKEKRRLI